MAGKLSVTFFPHYRKMKNGQHRVMGRISINRKKAEFSTDWKTDPAGWDEVNGRFKKNHVVNEELDKIKGKIYSFKTYLELEEKEVSARALKRLLEEKDKLRYGLLEYIDLFIEYHEDLGDLSDSSLSKYKATRKHLFDFLQLQQAIGLRLNEVDHKYLSLWDGYLATYQSPQFNRRLSTATVYKHHVRLKTIMLKAFHEGQIRKNPFAQFKLKAPARLPKYLTADELEYIKKADLGGNLSLEKVRDVFLFSCYTGLRYQDAQALTIHDLQNNGDGQAFIEICQQKTGEEVYIPLLKEAIRIIEQWTELDERLVKGYLLPRVSNVKVNAYLKVIQDLADIRTKLTHNVARHTFATTILLDQGVSLEVTSKLLGHTNLSTTQVYGKITKGQINSALDGLK